MEIHTVRASPDPPRYLRGMIVNVCHLAEVNCETMYYDKGRNLISKEEKSSMIKQEKERTIPPHGERRLNTKKNGGNLGQSGESTDEVVDAENYCFLAQF
jgi:hypothetical protein